MTVIKQVRVNDFRNISELALSLGPRFNFFYGHNGAGKTSFLEALYYLSRGRSFRVSDYRKLVQQEKAAFQLNLTVQTEQKEVVLGLERTRAGGRRIKVNQQSASSISELVVHLPLIFLSSLSYQFFTEGPKFRRSFVDWLTFHVKPRFFECWKRAESIIRQRNSAIKQHSAKEEILAWDKELSYLSYEIDLLRKETVSDLESSLFEYSETLLPGASLSLSYQRGWDEQADLESQLLESLYHDMRVGYTQKGPHRADFPLLLGQAVAGEVLSQGQQKVAIFALQLAMGAVLAQNTQKKPIFLLDDLASELDPPNRTKVVRELASTGSQVLVTGIVLEELAQSIDSVNASVFHVKRGSIETCESLELVNDLVDL